MEIANVSNRMMDIVRKNKLVVILLLFAILMILLVCLISSQMIKQIEN